MIEHQIWGHPILRQTHMYNHQPNNSGSIVSMLLDSRYTEMLSEHLSHLSKKTVKGYFKDLQATVYGVYVNFKPRYSIGSCEILPVESVATA